MMLLINHDGTTFHPAQDRAERPIQVVQLERYEYTLYHRHNGYFVKCSDGAKSMEHGPFSEEQANAMIESRIERHEELKR